MRRLLAILALLAASLASLPAQTFYISPSGNDTNPGTSLAQAWATVSHAAAQQNAGIIGPGSTVIVAAGTYADSIAIVNSTTVGSTTTPSYPLPSSGTATAPIIWVVNGTVNIDAADVVTGLTWASVGSGVYSATFTVHPEKLYVDDNNQDTPQLMPQSNAAGAFSATASYNEYDLTTQSGNQYLMSPNNKAYSGGSGAAPPWSEVSNAISPNDSQAFSATNTGLQNVTATPASWYITPNGSNWTVYVHLADGSSPAGHTLKATHRDYCVLLSSVDYVTFTGFTFEHAFKQNVYNVAALISTAGGNYFSGEYNQIKNSHLFNGGNIGRIEDVINSVNPNNDNELMGNMVFRAGGEANPHFLRYTQPMSQGDTFGTVDTYYGLRGEANTFEYGLIGAGIDAGGTIAPWSYSDNFASVNTGGILYAPTNVDLTIAGGNYGGRIAYDTCTNTIVCANVGSSSGPFRADHNFFHDYKGQGFQIGGSSTSSPTQPFILDHNVIANAGPAPSTVGFNAIDCNGVPVAGQFPIYEFNNTIFNTPDAGPTFETNCDHSHFYNNIVSQNAFISQMGTNIWLTGNGYNGTNGSSFMYFVSGSQTGADWHDNAYDAACATSTAGCSGNRFSSTYSCANFAAGWPETGVTLCENTPPKFVNAAGGATTANDFRLQATSPDIGAGSVISVSGVSSTVDLGAVPYGASFPFVAPALIQYQLI